MKVALARTLLSLMLLPPAAVIAQTNASAHGYFYGPDGALALVNIVRVQDLTTKVVTTELFYTFCGQANLGTSCQQGDGIIPNTAVTGTVLFNPNKPNVFAVLADTSAVVGYRNHLCTQGIDYDGSCLGQVPATGGLVTVTWTRTNDWANLNSSTTRQYQLGKLTGGDNAMSGSFSAAMAGTVLGVSAVSTEYAGMSTSSDSQALKEKFAALKVRTK